MVGSVEANRNQSTAVEASSFKDEGGVEVVRVVDERGEALPEDTIALAGLKHEQPVQVLRRKDEQGIPLIDTTNCEMRRRELR